MQDKYFYLDYLPRLGIVYSLDFKQIAFVKKRFPKIRYDSTSDNFILYYPGPLGFGPQTFYFDFTDFCAAFEDAKGNYLKPKNERFSLCDYFLGNNWIFNSKFGIIALILFCFNLTPSLLKKCRNAKRKISLTPKTLHCRKLPNLLPLDKLQTYMLNNY